MQQCVEQAKDKPTEFILSEEEKLELLFISQNKCDIDGALLILPEMPRKELLITVKDIDVFKCGDEFKHAVTDFAVKHLGEDHFHTDEM
jgi:hypothetical protein